MGTRGAWGFRLGGVDKLEYNHFDSYPGGLGEDIRKALTSGLLSRKGLRADVAAIRLIDEKEDAPTPEDIERCRPYTDLGVSRQSTSDWYCLLRNRQGDPVAAIQSGVMIDAGNFLADSLFCEWAYVINLDEECLEVYRGFQSAPHGNGRYAALPVRPRGTSCQYQPVALIKIIPFGDLSGFDMTSLEAREEEAA
jgi:hypothetical protein